jgi:hypothetical protein
MATLASSATTATGTAEFRLAEKRLRKMTFQVNDIDLSRKTSKKNDFSGEFELELGLI